MRAAPASLEGRARDRLARAAGGRNLSKPPRPLADELEVRAPGVAAALARVAGHLPGSIRRVVLLAAFDRARDAFNRGDLQALFALFAQDVQYVPPPPLHGGDPLVGRTALVEFWRGALANYEQSTIENLSLEEASPGRFVRRARLRHSRASLQLEYVIVQTTELRRGRVVRQVNMVEPGP